MSKKLTEHHRDDSYVTCTRAQQHGHHAARFSSPRPVCVNDLRPDATSVEYLFFFQDSEDALSTSSSSSTSSSPSSSCESFVREYDLENETGTIFLSQKLLGDVSCVVWDAALVLAKYLEKRCLEDEKFLSGKRVIELGSGLGCVGIVAACYG